MGLFYKVSDKELLERRNKIFVDKGIFALSKNGFRQSPFSGAWFGKDDDGGYSYELCRLTRDSEVQILEADIIKGESWIQIRLNIFKLNPNIVSFEELRDLDGIQFHLPPNSITRMRLRSDDYKGPPLFYMLFLPEHKIGKYKSKTGLERRIKELGDLIEKDMSNIDYFVKRWHEIHGEPMVTDWKGNQINKAT